jgi:hypothetical protein
VSATRGKTRQQISARSATAVLSRRAIRRAFYIFPFENNFHHLGANVLAMVRHRKSHELSGRLLERRRYTRSRRSIDVRLQSVQSSAEWKTK